MLTLASSIRVIIWACVTSSCSKGDDPCYAQYPIGGNSLGGPTLSTMNFAWCNSSQYWNSAFKALRQRQFFPDALSSKIVSGAPLHNYKNIRSNPLQSGTPGPLKVIAGLEVLRISNIDQKTQSFKVHFRLSLTWLDCRVLHNCSQFVVHDTDPFFGAYWQPMLVMKHIDTTPVEERMHDEFSVHPDGWITRTVDHTASFHCTYDFGNMPFDTQKCTISFYVSGLTVEEISWMPVKIDGEPLTAPEWDIAFPRHWRQSIKKMPIGHAFEHHVSLLSYEFDFKRKPGHLIWNYIIPSVWTYMVSWIGLFIDPTAVPARCAIAVFPVLIMVNKQIILDSSLPPSAGFSRLRVFMQATLALVVLHMFEFAFVELTQQRITRLRKECTDIGTGMLAETKSCDYIWRVGSISVYIVVVIVTMNL